MFTLSQTNNFPGAIFPDIQPDDEVYTEVVDHNEPTNERSLARRCALQALYEIDSSHHPAGDVLNALLAAQEEPLPRKTLTYMRRLVLGVTAYRQQLDQIIQRYASEWPLQQVAIVDRNVLRIAAFEFALLAGTPVGVAIDEAVELAKLFGAEGSPRFINGVLGALADDEGMLQQIADSFLDDDDDDDESGEDESDDYDGDDDE